ncbi:unnamed protein product [Acanthoscelides obtectus]|uniref:Uncharacterized protein n=1 Tax=Acanthoscelides obtectus TaxID=200917 RepID=A0A9P0M532_ACAOB|nr:unnamed protein product [Acanthoscelides obtectus]CAK1672214.1 hypothetical protein AOBTE_LOCUS28720 [Acanthoscelides obtectus]
MSMWKSNTSRNMLRSQYHESNSQENIKTKESMIKISKNSGIPREVNQGSNVCVL